MRAYVLGIGSWASGTCPNVEVPDSLIPLVHEYQGDMVISASDISLSGWTWEVTMFGGIPGSDFRLLKVD